jgi:hypothetical protein
MPKKYGVPKKGELVERVCEYCEAKYMTPYHGQYHTAHYCQTCKDEKVWMKRKREKWDEFAVLKKYTTFEDQ